MPELTELISLDNWRKIKPMLSYPIAEITPMTESENRDFQDRVNKAVRKVAAGVVPPPHELQVDPVSPAFEMWHDAEERN